MAKQVYKRRCSGCGGAVTTHHASFKVQLPKYEYDEFGRPTQVDGVREITCRGLGTWSCVNRCSPCKVRTTVHQVTAVTA